MLLKHWKSGPSLATWLFIWLSLAPSLSCCHKHSPQSGKSLRQPLRPAATQLVLPKNNSVCIHGDSVQIELSYLHPDMHIDSVRVSSDNNLLIVCKGKPDRIFWPTHKGKVGQCTLCIHVHYNDSLTDTHYASLVILSDIKPKPYTYKVVKKYPHDSHAYTQGLFFHQGMLYESTGLEGQSSLRIVDIITGKPVKMIALAQEFFGEGITLFNEQIFQLTYKTKVGFVYDKNTLQKIRSFDYPMDEGWGLTSNGKNLIMSDGSEQLYFMDPEFFTQTGRVEVFDNQGRIRQLNELEYVRGKILANVYGEGYILIINAETGKVTGKLNLQALIPEGFQGDFGRVLNGIAFNPENGNLYVTGKNWPVLYEIAVSPSLTF